MKVLKPEEIEENLRKIPGWTVKNNKITKEFKFKDFTEATNFPPKLVDFCNGLDHHPDITIEFSKVTFFLNRYDIGGKITDNDFTVAKEIERLYKKRS